MKQILKQYQDYVPDDATQKRLNQATIKGGSLADEHRNFLAMLLAKIDSGEINPMSAQTLYNHPVYDKLSEQDQEAADLTAMNLMSVIRHIEALWRQDSRPTFQIQNLVETVWRMKSKFEAKHGDVYII